jgi:hypothetical protein
VCLKLQRKQQNTKSALKKWNRDVFGHCQKRINDITEQLQKIQHKDCTEENYKSEVMLQSEMNEWLLRSEMLWRQKSREMWLKDGDKNSKFFHLSTLIRRRRNSVDAIKSNSRDWITDKKEIKKVFLSNFIEQFSKEEVDFPCDLENLISPVISTEENESLCSIPTPQEIKKVVFEMYDLKAPGPDGLPALFYKKYWDVVGADVVKAVTNFFYSGKMFQKINKSLIVLIPKVPNPSSCSHFRPISLCNVTYKIIAKLLVNKVRPLLPKLVSPCQSAFIPNYWIAENEVIVQEMLHSFKLRKVKEGLMAIKLDLQKLMTE